MVSFIKSAFDQLLESIFRTFFASRLFKQLSDEHFITLVSAVGNNAGANRVEAFEALKEVFDAKVDDHYSQGELVHYLVDLSGKHKEDSASHIRAFIQSSHPGTAVTGAGEGDDNDHEEFYQTITPRFAGILPTINHKKNMAQPVNALGSFIASFLTLTIAFVLWLAVSTLVNGHLGWAGSNAALLTTVIPVAAAYIFIIAGLFFLAQGIAIVIAFNKHGGVRGGP